MITKHDIVLIWFLGSLIITCVAVDTITLGQSIRDGNISETLVSAGGNFELGFISGTNGRRYLGIWFKKIPISNVVWIANRKAPISNSSGVLQLTNNSVLILSNGSGGGVLWSTNTTKSVKNPIAQILDDGNFVVRDRNDDSPDNFLWQSFDYPCDTMLPGMKLGRDVVTGFDRFLTAWKSSVDPSPGSYTYQMDPHGYPQPFVFKDSSIELFRDGPWNGYWFSGTPLLPDDTRAEFFLNDKEMYFTYETGDVPTRRTLDINGNILRLNWNNVTNTWETYHTKPNDKCDHYAVCGEFGICSLVTSVQCHCLKGFVPKSHIDWYDREQFRDGCVRSGPLNCSINNGFIKYSDVKLPDTRSAWYNTTMTLKECKFKCLQNCSCTAYASLNLKDQESGCLLWFGALMDVKDLNGPGQDLYLRAASDSGDRKKVIWIAIGSSLLAVLLICGTMTFVLRKKRMEERKRRFFKTRKVKKDSNNNSSNNNNNKDKEKSELPIFAFSVVEQATNSFSQKSKLGEGGFGPVYKGLLVTGEDIAVKRLSKKSRQGLNEFKNEALFIARLQHRNLVRLIGCCVEAEERILIYEYMPNKSLDRFIFGETSKSILDWTKRFEIIKGIARGLLYLHEDSRLRIVHRDLKASNVLLDFEMNPKISDFGLARSFDGNDCEAMTTSVVGTYGYMPPEYVIDGVFSVKSDVYSFGVLVLEILSGKRNRGFNHSDHQHNLVGHTWMLFRDSKTLDIVEPLIRNPKYEYEMQRAIHLGLLCVQQHPEDRPSMSFVTAMLSGDSKLPEPKEPGFYFERIMPQYSVSSTPHSSTHNEITMTLFSGR